MQQYLESAKKYVGSIVTAVLIAVALPTVITTSAEAAFGGRIGGEGGYVVTGTTNTLTSGTANITVKYLRKAGDYTNWKAWIWCNDGTGTWGTGVKQAANNASGSCKSGGWIDLGTGHDSWGAQTTFTVTGVTNLVSFGIIVYSRLGDGDIVNPRDSQSANNRYFNVNGANTIAWLSDDGKDIFDGDPKPGYATYNYGTTTTSKFRIHYNRADGDYTGYYANLGFEQGSNGNYAYRNLANKASYQFQKAINFNGSTTSTYGTYATGRDAFGPYVDFIPSTSWYTGGFTYLTVCISQSSTDNLGANGCATGDGGYRWLAPTFSSPGTQDLYIQSGSGIGNSNPYLLKPTITASSPTPFSVSTNGGATVTLTGSNFTPVPNATPLVYIDGTVSVGTGTDSDSIATPVATIAASPGFSDTALTFTMPSLSAGSHTLYVSTAAGFSTGFAFTSAVPIPAPTISALTPTSGVRGTTVAIAGTGLDSISAVSVGGVPASIAPSPNATSASFIVPQGAGSGSNAVIITNGGGTASSTFTVLDPPSVSGVSPTSGLRGTSVTLTGAFLTGATVTVGGATATPDSISATSIIFKIPAGAPSGLQSISVTTTGGTTSTNFTVLEVPAITSLSANSAVRGAPVTINGTGLQNATSVTVGGVSAAIKSNTSTAIGITVPATATPGPADIVVTSAGGVSNAQAFTVSADPPSIANVSPTSVQQGGLLTITGSALGGATVTIDGKNAAISAGASDTSLTVTVPSNATIGTASIALITVNGTDSSKTVQITAGVPSVTSVSPSAVPRGGNLTITGAYLADATSVSVGGVTLSTFTALNSTITGKVPNGAPLGLQTVSVVTAGGTATSSVTVLDVPVVSSISLASGKRGDSITISGTSFGAVSGVTVGGVAITNYTVNSLTSISATIPNGALSGAQSIVVTTSAGTSNNDKTFTVFDAPIVNSVTPSSGLLGSSVTLSGSNLKPTASDPTVTVAGQNAIVTSSSVTSVVITIPNGLNKNSPAPIVLTNAGGTSNTDKTFTPVDAPTLISATPTSAGRGTTVALVGTNLSNASSVTVNGVTAPIASSPAPNATSLTVTVPTGATSGLGNIVVTTSGGPSNSLPFTVLDVPTINSLSAISRSRGEQVTVTGNYLKNATFTIAGATATPVNSPAATDTSVTLTVPTTATFGATNVVATSTDGTASFPLTVAGYYGTASLKIHYHRSDFDFAKTYIHAWLGAGGTGTVSGATVGTVPGAQSPETLVTSDGVDSYGGVATVTVSDAADVQQICFLVWVNTTGNTFVKDTGSTPVVGYNGDRCYSLTSATSNEIWLQNTSRTIATSDPFAGILPSPNASTSQSVTIHYDGDTAKYPFVYVGTRSDLNIAPIGSPYAYWVDARFYSFTEPTTVTGTTGTYTSSVGTDTYGSYVTFTLPYYAAHTTRMNMIVTSGNNWSASPPPTKDGGSVAAGAEGNRYLNLNASGNTHIYLKAADTAGDSAFAANPYASPTIATLSSSTGKAGDIVTISGSNLVTNSNAPKVTVGGVVATPLTFPTPNATSVAFTVPNDLIASSPAPVRLTNSGGVSNSNLTFTLVGAPVLASPSPTAALRGAPVVITGTGLSSVTSVKVGDAEAIVTGNDATSVTFTVPTAAVSGSQSISVTTAGGTATTSFTVLDIPAITSVSPGSAIRGAAVTINGTGLQDASSVTVGGLSATISSNTATAISITVPMTATPGPANIVVTSPGGTSNSQSFTVLPDAPTVASVSPIRGPRSSTITVTGTNLTGLVNVTIGGMVAQVVSSPSATPNDSTVSVIVPVSLGSGAADVIVTTASGSAKLAGGFTVVDVPIITSPSPASGPRGTSVTISGNYFTGATAVSIGGVAAKSFTVNSATSITAVVADSAPSGLADIVVTTPGGTATSGGAFTVIDKPVISSLSQSSGPRGLSLTILGQYLSNVSSITFGSTVATGITDNTASSVTVTVPENSVTGAQTLSLITGGGTATASFTVVDAPTFSGIAPSAGGRGSAVTITGTNFIGASAIKFGGVAATTFAVKNAATISATIPQGVASGNVNVSVTTAGGTVTATNAYFVVDSPVITTLSVNKALRGTTVVITGTALDNPSSVKVGTISAPVLSTPAPTSDSLSITIPQGALSGATTIVVTTVAGESNAYSFSVLDAPAITSLSKSVGKRGDLVTVTGEYLTGAAFTIGDAVATPASSPAASDTSVTLLVPDAATFGAGAVVATTDGGIASKAFTVMAPPSISGLSSLQGYVGDSVTITGQNFDYLTSITVNGVTAVVEASPSAAPADTSVTIEIPAATSGVITITTLGGTATSETFTVLINPANITDVTPTQVRHGDTVTVSGTNLYGTTVTFGGASVTTSAKKDGTSLTFTVPNNASLGAASVVVKTADNQETNPVNVTVLANVPSVTSLSKTEVHRGDVVTATGENLAGTTATFAGSAIAVDVANDGKSLTFTVPADANLGTSSFVVTTIDNQVTSPKYLTVLADIPTLTALSVSQAHRGDVVTVSGTKLSAVSIKVDTWTATLVSPSPDATSITFAVPDGVDTGVVEVVAVTVDDQTSNSLPLTVLYDTPMLNSVTPAKIYPGTVVTVSGIYLSGTVFTFSGSSVEVTINSNGTSATFTVPNDATLGNTQVVATTPDQQTASIALTVLSNLPTLTAISASKALRGATLNLTGTRLIDATTVKFGSVSVTNFVVNSATSISVVVPTAVPTGVITIAVVTPDGTTTGLPFTVLPSAPKITKFTQSTSTKRGVGTVTVTGTNLLGATVKVGALTATVRPGTTNSKLVFVLPAKAVATKIGQFTITTQGGSAKSVKTLKITIK